MYIKSFIIIFVFQKYKNMDLEALFYEAKQRINWFIDGMNQHGLSPELFSKLSTERIVEIYNIEMSYFRMEK